MKSFRVCMIASVFVFLFASSALSAPKTVIPIYTPGSGGTAYLIGGAIATIMNKYIPEVQMMVEATGGTAAMSRLLGEKAEKNQPAFGIGDSKFFYMAYKGLPPFTKALPIQGVTFAHGASLCLVVPKNSPIKSYADLKGKRVGVGAAGSGTSQISVSLIDAFGITTKMYKVLWLGYNEVSEGIKDGSIDAGFISGTYPIPALQELAFEKDVRIVPVDEAILKKVLDENPYFYGESLKPGAYKGVTQNTPILVFGSVLVTHNKVDADLVYKITKTIYEHRDEIQAIAPQVRDMHLKNALLTIANPFNPGAIKYFKETGVMK
jgi:TRAP transporter TAXI family solute receptor